MKYFYPHHPQPHWPQVVGSETRFICMGVSTSLSCLHKSGQGKLHHPLHIIHVARCQGHLYYYTIHLHIGSPTDPGYPSIRPWHPAHCHGRWLDLSAAEDYCISLNFKLYFFEFIQGWAPCNYLVCRLISCFPPQNQSLKTRSSKSPFEARMVV